MDVSKGVDAYEHRDRPLGMQKPRLEYWAADMGGHMSSAEGECGGFGVAWADSTVKIQFFQILQILTI